MLYIILTGLLACNDAEQVPTEEGPTESELVTQASDCGKEMKKYALRVEKLSTSKDANNAPKAQQAFYKMKGQLEKGKVKEECKGIHAKLDKKFAIAMEEIGQKPKATGQEIAEQKKAEKEAERLANESCKDRCSRTQKDGSAAAKLMCMNKCEKEKGEQ